MAKSRRQTARLEATIGVYQYLLVGSSFDEICDYLAQNETLSNDKKLMDFSKWLVSTVIDNFTSYKQLIEKYLKKGWTFDRISVMEQAILLIATCELLESDLNEKIVINEAVINAKDYCEEDSYKFINGVLSKIV